MKSWSVTPSCGHPCTDIHCNTDTACVRPRTYLLCIKQPLKQNPTATAGHFIERGLRVPALTAKPLKLIPGEGFTLTDLHAVFIYNALYSKKALGESFPKFLSYGR